MHIKRFRWFLVLFTAMSLAYIAMPIFALEKQNSNGAVAVVNGAVITQADFDREMIRVHSQFASNGRSLSESGLSDIKKGVLETLINRELLYQESQKIGVRVENKEVNEQFDILKKRFSSEDEFKNVLLEMKTSEVVLKSQLQKGMAIQQLVDKEFVQKVKVPEKEVKDFYKKNPNRFKKPEQVRARHILIKVDPGADESKKSAAREKLKEAQKKLSKGEDFEALAKEYSEGPSGANGGDLGYFSRGQMVKPFEESAFALLPGKVSDIVETRFGYHLIKVIDKKPASTTSYEQIKDKLQDYLKQRKVHEKVNIYIEKLKGKAKVEKLLDNNS